MTRQEIDQHLEAAARGCAARAATLRAASQAADKALHPASVARALALDVQAGQWQREAKAIEAVRCSLPQ